MPHYERHADRARLVYLCRCATDGCAMEEGVEVWVDTKLKDDRTPPLPEEAPAVIKGQALLRHDATPGACSHPDLRFS